VLRAEKGERGAAKRYGASMKTEEPSELQGQRNRGPEHDAPHQLRQRVLTIIPYDRFAIVENIENSSMRVLQPKPAGKLGEPISLLTGLTLTEWNERLLGRLRTRDVQRPVGTIARGPDRELRELDVRAENAAEGRVVMCRYAGKGRGVGAKSGCGSHGVQRVSE
jgi:hypothetical protein